MDKQRQKYKGLLDMIDGGGAGAVGNEFEGGGLLSVIANAIATPYGSSDRMRDAMQGQRPIARTDGGFSNGSANSVASTQGMSLDAGPAMPRIDNGTQLAFPGNPSGPIDDGLGPMPQRILGDSGLGFNFANAAPVQVEGSGMTLAPSVDPEFTMPDGSSINRAAPMQDPYNNSVDNSYQRFTEELFELFGPEVAPSYIGTGAGEMLYNNYVKNGYRFPVN